jgi:hypothetical protein
MADQIVEKSLRHVSLCVSDLATAKAFYDILGSRSCGGQTSASPGAWLSVDGDLLYLLEEPE